MRQLFVFCAILFLISFSASAAERLSQIISEPIPPQTPVRMSARSIPFDDVVIASNRPGHWTAAMPQKLRDALARAWGDAHAPAIVDPESARKSGKTVLLIGDSFANDLIGQLQILPLIGGLRTPEGELRVIPGAPSDRPEILYFGGASPEAVEGRIREFLRRYPERPSRIPFFVDCVNPKIHEEPRIHQKRFDQLYRNGATGENVNNTILSAFFRLAEDFNLTGNDAYARIFAAEIRRFYQHYDALLGPRKAPPHFTAWQFPAAVDAIEESSAFTAEDLYHSLELCRYFSEHIMSHGDLNLPKKIYDENQRQYMTNHPINGIRSMYFNGVFLKQRCDLAAADYWIAISEHGFECIAGFPFGPEDSVSYQAFNLNLLISYIVGSGKGGSRMFQTQEMKDYLSFCKAMIDPRGNIVNFGDGYPITSPTANGHFRRLLLQCYLHFNDADTGFYLKRIQDFHAPFLRPDAFHLVNDFGKLPETPAGKTTGLMTFPLRKYKYQLLKRENVFDRPVLDKAAFRSSWDPASSLYAYFTGVNGGPHGHEDANALSSLVIDGEEWIGDRDYVKRYAPDHNRVSVIRDGQSFPFPVTADAKWNFSQLCGAAESKDRQRGVLSMLVEDYNGADYRRDVCLDAKRGLFIIDRITANIPGDYLLECRYQVLGRPDSGANDRNSRFTRPGSEFHIAGAESADVKIFSRFESGSNAREAGYFGAYLDQGGANSAHWTARKECLMDTGDTVFFAHYLHTGQEVPFLKIAEGLWRSASEDPVLIGCGKHLLGAWNVDADFFVLSKDGFLGTGIRQGLPENADPAQILKTVCAIQPLQQKLPEELPAEPLTPQIYDAPVTALAQYRDQRAIGLGNGTLSVGNASVSFGQSITALAAIPDGKGGFCWAAGIHPAPEEKLSSLVLLTGDLQEKWRYQPLYYQVHRPVIRDIFPAFLQPGKAPAVVIGTKAWMFLTVDQETGKMLHRLPVLHPSINGAAGDLDGDGADEIITGAEYYSSPIYDASGKALWNRTQPPYALHQVSADLDRDGKAEFYSLRGNGTLLRFRLETDRKGQPKIRWTSANIGGEGLGAAVHQGKLYTLTTSGILCVTDGAETRTIRSLGRQFTAFCGGESGLFAMDPAGVIARIDPETGKELRRYRASFDPAGVLPVLAETTPDGAVFAVGNHLYRIVSPPQP